jgi:hypothetical protein
MIASRADAPAMESTIMNAQRKSVHQMGMPEPRESLGDLLGDLMT